MFCPPWRDPQQLRERNKLQQEQLSFSYVPPTGLQTRWKLYTLRKKLKLEKRKKHVFGSAYNY
jgi:hypothetical protein